MTPHAREPLQLRKLAFKQPDPSYGTLHPLSYDFEFGKAYFLDGPQSAGGWALSWIIGGLLIPTDGQIFWRGLPYPIEQRRKDAWCVRRDEIRIGICKRPRISVQVIYGLRKLKNTNFKNKEDVINKFMLTPQRFNRPMRQLSGEAWRASCAIGFVNGRIIFCFPFWDNYYIETSTTLWLPELIELLKDLGAMILIPTIVTSSIAPLADTIIPLTR